MLKKVIKKLSIALIAVVCIAAVFVIPGCFFDYVDSRDLQGDMSMYPADGVVFTQRDATLLQRIEMINTGGDIYSAEMDDTERQEIFEDAMNEFNNFLGIWGCQYIREEYEEEEKISVVKQLFYPRSNGIAGFDIYDIKVDNSHFVVEMIYDAQNKKILWLEIENTDLSYISTMSELEIIQVAEQTLIPYYSGINITGSIMVKDADDEYYYDAGESGYTDDKDKLTVYDSTEGSHSATGGYKEQLYKIYSFEVTNDLGECIQYNIRIEESRIIFNC